MISHWLSIIRIVKIRHNSTNWYYKVIHVHRHNLFTKKHKNMPFPPPKRYLWRSGRRSTVQGSRHTWTLEKNQIVSHIVSLPLLNYPPSVLRGSCWLPCWLLCCCHVVLVFFIYFVAVLPTLPPPPLSARRHQCHCCRLAWRLTETAWRTIMMGWDIISLFGGHQI